VQITRWNASPVDFPFDLEIRIFYLAFAANSIDRRTKAAIIRFDAVNGDMFTQRASEEVEYLRINRSNPYSNLSSKVPLEVSLGNWIGKNVSSVARPPLDLLHIFLWRTRS